MTLGFRCRTALSIAQKQIHCHGCESILSTFEQLLIFRRFVDQVTYLPCSFLQPAGRGAAVNAKLPAITGTSSSYCVLFYLTPYWKEALFRLVTSYSGLELSKRPIKKDTAQTFRKLRITMDTNA